MDWTYLFTSIDGRIGRQPFWIALVILIGIEIVADYAIGERWSSAVSLLLAYVYFAVIAKRGHDRNAPTWTAGVFMAGIVILEVLNLLNLLGPLDEPNIVLYVIGIPLLVMGVILLIDFGFRRGTVGPNRYGADPLAAAR